jgi:cytochrome c biogenesis protein CcdA
VLPLLPIVLGAAVSQHRWGPLALASGLAISFTFLGLLIAIAGYALGLDGGVFRTVAAIIMVVMGSILLVPAWQTQFATAGGPVSGWADRRFGGISGSGLGGQFAMGLLLGAVWSPCVGPTLGAASLLASQGRNLAQVALTMTVFGFGAALPLAILGLLSRAALVNMRDRMLSAGQVGKVLLGVTLLVIGVGIVTGTDKWLETVLVGASPAWLTELTTRF